MENAAMSIWSRIKEVHPLEGGVCVSTLLAVLFLGGIQIEFVAGFLGDTGVIALWTLGLILAVLAAVAGVWWLYWSFSRRDGN